MTHFDPDERQQVIADPQPDDRKLVLMTYLQALKCAAVIDAATDGHEAYQDALALVNAFLRAVAVEGVRGAGVIRPSSQEAWRVLDELPWPVSGPPRSQPDVPR